jgi:hypothetical protein
MAAQSDEASWSGLEPMGAVQHPRLITKSDVPRLGDRIKQVLSGSPQHRSGWENATYLISILLLMTASSIIWHSASGVALKLVEAVVALLVIGSAGTAVLLKLRFRR